MAMCLQVSGLERRGECFQGRSIGVFQGVQSLVKLGSSLLNQLFEMVFVTLLCNYQVLMLQSRSEEHTSELQSLTNLVCRLLLEKKKATQNPETEWDARTSGSAEWGDVRVQGSVQPTARTQSGWRWPQL